MAANHKNPFGHLKKGALHHELGLTEGQKIPEKVLAKNLEKAKKSGNVTEQRRIQFAENAKKFHH